MPESEFLISLMLPEFVWNHKQKNEFEYNILNGGLPSLNSKMLRFEADQ
jgi:hypothetical protein